MLMRCEPLLAIIWRTTTYQCEKTADSLYVGEYRRLQS